MSKPSLWGEFLEVLDPCDHSIEEVSMTDLFNFFDSNVLVEFLEFLKSESED